jgi:hypothetical protein
MARTFMLSCRSAQTFIELKLTMVRSGIDNLERPKSNKYVFGNSVYKSQRLAICPRMSSHVFACLRVFLHGFSCVGGPVGTLGAPRAFFLNIYIKKKHIYHMKLRCHTQHSQGAAIYFMYSVPKRCRFALARARTRPTWLPQWVHTSGHVKPYGPMVQTQLDLDNITMCVCTCMCFVILHSCLAQGKTVEPF